MDSFPLEPSDPKSGRSEGKSKKSGRKRRSPFRREDWPTGVARISPSSGHKAGELSLSDAVPLRAECWESIGEKTRERLLEHAGQVIEWWAAPDPADPHGRPLAVVFGEKGLAIAEPRLNSRHEPAYAVSCYLLDPESFRYVDLDHRPLPRPRLMRRKKAAESRAEAESRTEPETDSPKSAPVAKNLSAAARAVLGNLPDEAQELLQGPFLSGQAVLRHDWYYEGSERKLSVFVFFLAGRSDVTVAHGTKVVPAGHTEETAHWSLVCHRASVLRRIGR